MIPRFLSSLLTLPFTLALAVPAIDSPAPSNAPGFTFPSYRVWHPGDRLPVRWHGSSANATARIALYGPFANVAALKQTPHTHFVTTTHPVPGRRGRFDVHMSLQLPRSARKGYYDVQAVSTVRWGQASSSSGGDTVISVSLR